MTSTTMANATSMTLTSCQRNSLLDIPREMGVGELEGRVEVGATGVKLVRMDAVVVLEGAVPMLLLVLLLMDTPVLDRGLLVMVAEEVRVEQSLFPWPAALDGTGLEAPKEEHASSANCLAATWMSALLRGNSFG